MSHPQFPHLFSPLEIRGKEIKNRVFVPGHNTALSEGGRVGDGTDLIHPFVIRSINAVAALQAVRQQVPQVTFAAEVAGWFKLGIM